MENQAFLNGEFINLYTKENPILEVGNECYALIFNISDYHYPLIIKGTIILDKYVDGMNKQYFIKVDDILETPKTKDKYLFGKQFFVYTKLDGKIANQKTHTISRHYNFEKNLFKIEAYFVRNSLKKIQELRLEYVQIIKEDLQKMLSDVNSILSQNIQ